MADAVFKSQSTAGGDTNVDNESVSTTVGGAAVSALRQRVRIGGSTGSLLAEVNNNGGLFTSDIAERRSGATLTASSGVPGIGAAGMADPGVGYPAGSTVVLAPAGDHSSWTVQVSGTWTGRIYTEVTADGTNWLPVNSRQSAGGRLANNFTANGLFRGVFGGLTSFRVRVSSDVPFTGTASVYIALGDDAAVFSNSDVLVQGEPQYYASSAGLNSMWGAGSQEVACATAGTEYPILFVQNTTATTQVMYVWRISLGANNSGRFRRYSANSGFTHTSGGTAITPKNRALQTPPQPTAATVYAGTSMVLAGKPTTYDKSVFLGAANLGGAQDTTTEDGSLLIPSGAAMAFYFVPDTANTVAQAELVWWDGSSLT